jgi:spermidine synthase
MTTIRIDEPLNDTSGAYFDGEKTLDRNTGFQHLEVFNTPDLGRLFKLDGYNMVSEKDEFFYHENLVHPLLIAHPEPRRALIIGGGDGGTAEEVLKHPSIDYVRIAELDGEVVALCREQFASVHRGAFADPRLDVVIEDGLAHLNAVADDRARGYDVILFDLTDPLGPAQSLYSEATFALCRDALRPGGAMSLHLGSPFVHSERVRSIHAALRRVFRHVAALCIHIPMYGSNWALAVASEDCDPRMVSRDTVAHRIANRRLQHLQFYNEDTHHAVFAQPNYLRALLAA